MIALEYLKNYITKSQVNTFEEFYYSLKYKYQQEIINFALDFALKKNEGLTRKTGAANATHAVQVAVQAINFKLPYTSVAAALLHDVIEDEIDRLAKKTAAIPLWPLNKEKNKSEIREKLFANFIDEFYAKKLSKATKDAKNDIAHIIDVVNVLTRYRHEGQHYYDYIKKNLSNYNTEFPDAIIYDAILVKYLDRLDNITSMDTELRKVMNKKIRAELRVLNHIASSKVKKKYKKLLEEQNSLLLDYSFNGGNRLNQIWKNTYLIIRTRMYFAEHQDLYQHKKTQEIENKLLDGTIKVLQKHKDNLRVYLPAETTQHWDQLAKTYAKLGGIDGKTKTTSTKITEKNEYLTFNSTIEDFSQFLLKNNKEFKKLLINKETQYKYLSLIYEMLYRFLHDKNYVCDLSTVIEIE